MRFFLFCFVCIPLNPAPHPCPGPAPEAFVHAHGDLGVAPRSQASPGVQCRDAGYSLGPLLPPARSGAAEQAGGAERGLASTPRLLPHHLPASPPPASAEPLSGPAAPRTAGPAPDAGHPGAGSPYINRPFALLRPRASEFQPVPNLVPQSSAFSSFST